MQRERGDMNKVFWTVLFLLNGYFAFRYGFSVELFNAFSCGAALMTLLTILIEET